MPIYDNKRKSMNEFFIDLCKGDYHNQPKKSSRLCDYLITGAKVGGLVAVATGVFAAAIFTGKYISNISEKEENTKVHSNQGQFETGILDNIKKGKTVDQYGKVIDHVVGE